MITELKKIWPLIRRDLQIYFSYKLAVSMAFFSILFNFIYMVLFGSIFEEEIVPILAQYGGNFISYLLIGSVGWGFIWSIMSQIAESLRTEMELGTLESIILTPTSIYTVIISYAIFGSFFGLLVIMGLLLIGYILFGINVFVSINLYTILILLLSLLIMIGMGMILGGLTFWVKNIGQTAPLLQSIAMLFSGIYFPITVLPEFIQPIALINPFYWSIEGLRMSLVQKISIYKINTIILILNLFSFIFLAIGAYTLRLGIKKAKKEGTLSYY